MKVLVISGGGSKGASFALGGLITHYIAFEHFLSQWE